jgi:hypothetical protein
MSESKSVYHQNDDNLMAQLLGPLPSPVVKSLRDQKTEEKIAETALKMADLRGKPGTVVAMDDGARQTFEKIDQMSLAAIYINEAQRSAMIPPIRTNFWLRNEDVYNKHGLACVVQISDINLGEKVEWDGSRFVAPYPAFTIIVTDAKFEDCCKERDANEHGEEAHDKDEHLVRNRVYQCAYDDDLQVLIVATKEEINWIQRGETYPRYYVYAVDIQNGETMMTISAQIARAHGFDGDADRAPCNYHSAKYTEERESTTAVALSTCLLLNSTRCERTSIDDPERPQNRQQQRNSKRQKRECFVIDLVKGKFWTAIRNSSRGVDIRQRAAHWVRSHLRHYANGFVTRVRHHHRNGVPQESSTYNAKKL